MKACAFRVTNSIFSFEKSEISNIVLLFPPSSTSSSPPPLLLTYQWMAWSLGKTSRHPARHLCSGGRLLGSSCNMLERVLLCSDECVFWVSHHQENWHGLTESSCWIVMRTVSSIMVQSICSCPCRLDKKIGCWGPVFTWFSSSSTHGSILVKLVKTVEPFPVFTRIWFSSTVLFHSSALKIPCATSPGYYTRE